MARKFTAQQKHQLMTKLLGSQAGRRKIAASIQEPLRRLRDYQAIGRKAFEIDELPDGALPIYDKDIDVNAYVVGEQGDSVQEVIQSTRVMIPIFELASLPRIPFVHVKERRFDVVSRIKKKTKDELFRKEDRRIFQTISTAGENNNVNAQISVAEASFNMGTMTQAFAQVERHGHRVDKIFMNAVRFKMFRDAGRDYLDFETQRELLRTGFMGMLYGAQIYTSPEVAEDEVHLITEPEYFGVMPVRIDLTVIPADDPVARMFGWSVFEAIGIGVHNVTGEVSVKIT